MTETDYRCPDCGRESCTGEDCYWPDEAGIPPPRARGGRPCGPPERRWPMTDRNTAERGGYSAGSRTAAELPPPPPSVSVKKAGTRQMTMGEFRELTADAPDDWPVVYVVRTAPDDFEFYPADASVDETNRTVDIYDA